MSPAGRYIAHSLLFLLAAATAHAQEAFRASWTIQDKAHGLRQEFAANVIRHANDWLTRDDPYAATARLDDPVRVTVVGELLPSSKTLRTRLAQLVLGTIVIDGHFDEFLDTATIASIVRRDHYWRDESYVVVNEAYAPRYATAAMQPRRISPQAEQESGTMPRIRLRLDDAQVDVGDDFSVWGSLGFQQLGLPDFTYAKVRAGIDYKGMRAWGEIPHSIGAMDNPLLARGLTGTFGAGVSFRTEMLSAAVTWSEAPDGADSTAVEGYTLDRAAIFGVHLLSADLPFLNSSLAIRIGGGYQHLVHLRRPVSDAAATTRELERLLPSIEGELVSNGNGDGRRTLISMQLFGDSFIGAWWEQFSETFGLRLSVSAHGLAGDRDPFLPSYSILLSPTLNLR